jgi:hypothetical protein
MLAPRHFTAQARGSGSGHRIFRLNPSSHTMALGLTQHLTEMSTRDISWGIKGGWCTGLTTLPPSCADY